MQLHDVYDSMVMAVARIGRDRPELRFALRDAVHHLAHAIPYLDDPDRHDSEVAWFAAHEAYLSVLALSQQLADLRVDGHDDAGPAHDAVGAALDALGPRVSAADRALRCVLIENESLDAAAHRLLSA